jgi:3-oxoacyl-[acyl-carrier protein] reductase
MKNTKILSGKVALVTDGSRGFGAAISKRLALGTRLRRVCCVRLRRSARRHLSGKPDKLRDGADVALTYVSSASSASSAELVVSEIERANGRGFAVQADQGDADAVASLVTSVHERFGRLDILVLNAGLSVGGMVDDPYADTAEFDRQFAVNVLSTAVAVRTAVPFLTSGGRIITIGSVFGKRTVPGFGDYSATKAAVAGYTRGWARDLGARDITAKVVQPGPINTEMNPANSPHAPLLTGMTALNRYGTADEVASAVAFLASPEASYITGATLNVDGGVLA